MTGLARLLLERPLDGARVAALLVAALLAGFGASRIRSLRIARPIAWAVVLAAGYATHVVTLQQTGLFRMLALCAVTLVSMKGVVSVEAAAEGRARLAPRRWFIFATLWPGMRPELFDGPRAPDSAGAARLARSGLVRLAIGAALLVAARVAWIETHSKLLATALALPGLSLAFHFGAFNLQAAALRAVGFPVEPLFQAPLYSTSLNEFWGRRWNLAFSEMTKYAVHRPLKAAVGRRAGVIASFVFSGLLHELAISLPVLRGFGLPLLYFAIHGGAMLVEDRMKRPPGRVWTIALLALPMPILFHPPFLEGTVWPILCA